MYRIGDMEFFRLFMQYITRKWQSGAVSFYMEYIQVTAHCIYSKVNNRNLLKILTFVLNFSVSDFVRQPFGIKRFT